MPDSEESRQEAGGGYQAGKGNSDSAAAILARNCICGIFNPVAGCQAFGGDMCTLFTTGG